MQLAQRRVEHRLVCGIVLAAGKSDLAAVHAAGIAQNHHDVKLAVAGSIDGNDYGRIDHAVLLGSAVLRSNIGKQANRVRERRYAIFARRALVFCKAR
jgi:hypothetical protein